MSDEERIGAVIDEMYAMISGPAGPRDWSRQRNSFLPEARQVRTWVDEQGRPEMKIAATVRWNHGQLLGIEFKHTPKT